ncbi:hypothetical protein C2S51_037565 [Perilla frutescens var. frutescens]|nr:hypothetical protein C2S51_037565 [Perilla frutescens var. frutescens]
MEFLQEPTFTVFLALVLSLLVAKIVSFAVSNSTADDNTAVSSVSEGAVAKEATLDRGLMVRRGKGEKRVKFVDDVVIRRVDRYEGSENLAFLDDVGEVGDVIVEEKSVNQNYGERVDQFEGNGLGGDSRVRKGEEECSDLREMDEADALVEGCERTETMIRKEVDGGVSENVETLVTGGVKSEVELEGDGMVVDEREGNGEVGCGEREEVVRGEVKEKGDVRDESVDDDWEGIERSELEKVFAEAVNYVEYGGKDKEDDRLGKLGSDVQMQLYGLHKVAVEGPCREPQPMALMVSARAKWNSWQKLGSMSREVAMQQYIEVLSKNIPERMHEHSADDDIQRNMETEDEIFFVEQDRKSELSTAPVIGYSTSHSSVDKVDAV